MPKPRLYHHFLRARITREQRKAIQAYAKHHKLCWGEAVRELVERALEQDRDGTGRSDVQAFSGEMTGVTNPMKGVMPGTYKRGFKVSGKASKSKQALDQEAKK